MNQLEESGNPRTRPRYTGMSIILAVIALFAPALYGTQTDMVAYGTFAMLGVGLSGMGLCTLILVSMFSYLDC